MFRKTSSESGDFFEASFKQRSASAYLWRRISANARLFNVATSSGLRRKAARKYFSASFGDRLSGEQIEKRRPSVQSATIEL